ncbi:MAG TPA: thiamine-phosphate kinase, partial [bacterium]|nr:thiamine-phosphate kinase [bacterium]
MNEFQLIDYIKKLGSAKIRESSQNNLVKGIGDDAAVIKIKKNKFYLITTDALIENVHFSLDTITLYNLGYKSVIVNVSDILSKNGLPLYLLGSINIPPKIKNIHQFIKGINDACKKYNITLIGGDTTSSKNDFCISLTLIGETNKALYRSGYIENGDLICVSNTVGLSGAGFYAVNELNKYQKKK